MKIRTMQSLSVALTLLAVVGTAACMESSPAHMPAMESPHEGTWLQWPHHHTYGAKYRDRLDAVWIEMTRALVAGERVHILAYNAMEQTRITTLLNTAAVPLANVDFLLCQTDDVWVRDNGPVFVFDTSGDLKITDWDFDGWGDDAPFVKDNLAPASVATARGLPRADMSATVLEGGSLEVDGQGVLMATRSSILEPKRNPGLTQARIEDTLRTQLGVTKFIWLDGAPGGKEDITDTHIDGFAMFGPNRTIVTMSHEDLAAWGLSQADITALNKASDIHGVPYSFVRLPLTANNVVTTDGRDLGYKGSYANFYAGNTTVLAPIYHDPNDTTAMNILQTLYPGRKVVGIDARNLCAEGGMIHCVTQQQPEKVMGETDRRQRRLGPVSQGIDPDTKGKKSETNPKQKQP